MLLVSASASNAHPHGLGIKGSLDLTKLCREGKENRLALSKLKYIQGGTESTGAANIRKKRKWHSLNFTVGEPKEVQS